MPALNPARRRLDPNLYWSTAMTSAIPRPEYPRPQFVRPDWVNLNGPWTCEFDPGRSGEARGLIQSTGFRQTIQVPFCPESTLSGIGHTDFIDCLWYHRTVTLPSAWSGKKILLHFGAVDYSCRAWLDGKLLGRHVGGSASFHFPLDAAAQPGRPQQLVVEVRDHERSGAQTLGKQSRAFASAGCCYTRVTGIWQTVWLEAVDPAGLAQVHTVPDFDGSRLVLTPRFFATRRGHSWIARVKADGQMVSELTAPAVAGVPVALPLPAARPWSPQDPFLYDLEFEVRDRSGAVLDRVQSYAGLRKIHLEGDRLFLNNQPLFQRLVLDQGFYPAGIWTAPSDADLKRDIELSQAAGFNGARLHQKVFEERFHYWADRLGYLTWGESASWGMGLFSRETWDGENPAASEACSFNFLAEWREVLERDRNHPSIVAWSPFNETAHARDWNLHRKLHADAAALTRTLDPTRPVNDASGYTHVDTDLWTVHHYEQDPAKLKSVLTPDPLKGVFRNYPGQEADYAGQPYLVDEFGGIQWVPETRRSAAAGAWGYGAAPQSLDEFYTRLAGQVEALLSLPHIRGYCYTQLTDVEQEQNGIYNYDRSPKFDPERIRKIFSQQPESQR